MALREADKSNFETLKRAMRDGALALLECEDTKTGEYRAVLAAVEKDELGFYNITPFGHLCTGDPYNQYIPPPGGARY